MSDPVFIALAVMITCSMAAVDFASARYQRALHDAWAGDAGARHRAARWSVTAWAAAALGFYAAVRYSMALLPFEALGLYVGTLLAIGKHPRPRGS